MSALAPLANRFDFNCARSSVRCQLGMVTPFGSEPARRGYGRELIERALPYAVGAKTTYELRPDAVRCKIEMPLKKIEPSRSKR